MVGMKPAEAVSLPKWQRKPFQFDLVERNEELRRQGMEMKPVSTGTTLAALVYKDGVVLGADTRSSAGTVVADKHCMKIHPICPNMYALGCGTAGDCQHVTLMVHHAMELQRFHTGREARFDHAETLLKRHLFKYQGHVSAGIILGGVDVTGAWLSAVSPYGCALRYPFVADGSGSLAAIAVLEAKYNDDLTEEQAKALILEAVTAGTLADNGSGGEVDLCVVKKVDGVTKVDYRKPYVVVNERKKKPAPVHLPKHAAPIISERMEMLVMEEVGADGAAMDVDK
eukprot:TRINITY_DN66264_c0_g1_i1.p1 TRINITY_DN66264_c0_g1~~TRINITY_DN66264_c0_g1_i1.p1  ORF type:complete len:284 (+),score=102.38 TRINITY_DN66264_c0_g1_i1:83-934(+)